jgi:hypothetical protein
MIIALHKNARTTPAIRAEIAASKDSVAVLASPSCPSSRYSTAHQIYMGLQGGFEKIQSKPS